MSDERKNKRLERLKDFDPEYNGIQDHGIFGLPFSEEESEIVISPVPWHATVSYREGTAMAPAQILEASWQIDLYHPIYLDNWMQGIAMAQWQPVVCNMNDEVRALARDLINKQSQKNFNWKLFEENFNQVNEACRSMVDEVREKAITILKDGKIPGLVGGDHSTALGIIQASGNQHKELGVLQFDAHADLRKSYEGFKYSHASIIRNAFDTCHDTNFVSIGLRDISSSEKKFADNNAHRIQSFHKRWIDQKLFSGMSRSDLFKELIKNLPEHVHITLDIDALDPTWCPNTGTPVPGGFTFIELIFFIDVLVKSGRKIVSFDLCEVGASDENEWDSNVGARLLYELCMASLQSNS